MDKLIVDDVGYEVHPERTKQLLATGAIRLVNDDHYELDTTGEDDWFKEKVIAVFKALLDLGGENL